MKEMLNSLNVLLQSIKFLHMDSLGEINNSFSYCLDNALKQNAIHSSLFISKDKKIKTLKRNTCFCS